MITENNILLYAAKYYDNTNCYDMQEFYDDLNLPAKINKLFVRYRNTGVLNEKLIINHIISFFNVFKGDAAMRILFFRIEDQNHSLMKTFLVYLGWLTPTITIKGTSIDRVIINTHVLEYLEKKK